MAPAVPNSKHLLPQPLIRADHFCTSGQVTIHPSASIAPGVLLQADPGSQIVIAAAVSIGAGTILHAHSGSLEIGAGATLGTGVLVVGSGKIGSNACIGAQAMIWSSSIEPDQVIAPGAMVGDVGRAAVANAVSTDLPAAAPDAAPDAAPADAAPAKDASVLMANPPRGALPIYGQAAVHRLIESLFPHRQSLNGASPDRPPSDHA